MAKKQKRRKLDQFLHESRKDPEVALSEMTRLSNRLWRTLVGVTLTLGLIFLLLPIGQSSVDQGDWKRLVGLGFLLFLMNGLGWAAIQRIGPGMFDRPASFNRFVMLLVATIVGAKIIFICDWSPFLVPIPFLSMVMGMAYGSSITLLVVIGAGFYIALLSPRMWEISTATIRVALEDDRLTGPVDPSSMTVFMNQTLSRMDPTLGIALILGGVIAVLGVQRIRQQSKPALVGLLAGVTQAVVVIAFQVLDPDFNYKLLSEWAAFLRNPAWAVLGGLICGGVLTVILPVIERLDSRMTVRRLLALSDPNNELLRTLRNRAPGTYQHTLGVAQLASAAAEAIGAEALFCQVGAYYHDIGKLVKPEYFVENMGEDKTIHSRLRPSMSKIIIISHVKEGIELAQEEKLPQRIIDMIPMHHGTTVVEYFFHKAVELSNGESRESESEYRYPGPRPRFKEAGILMLADTVEAVAKTVVDPTPTRFQGVISEMVRKRLHDGQLDQCNLTIRDLRKIEDSFVRTLTNMYHARIRYPSNGEEESTPPNNETSERTPAIGTSTTSADRTTREQGRSTQPLARQGG